MVDWARIKNGIRLYLFIGFLTATMSLLETENPLLLGLSILTTGTIVVIDLLSNWIVLGVLVTLGLGFIIVLVQCVKTLESFDRSGRMYDSAWDELVAEAEGKAAGAYEEFMASLPRIKKYPGLLRQTVPADQNAKKEAFLDYLVTQAKGLEDDYLTTVLQPVSDAAGAITRTTSAGCPVYGDQPDGPFVGKRNFKCTCKYSRPPIAMGTKGKARCMEKTRMDYGGDLAQLKDVLRASVYAKTLEDFRSFYEKIAQLEDDGILVVEQCKNRFLQKSTGYRDINYNLRFRDHVCELQLHVAPFVEIKDSEHKYYESARSVGLAGDLPLKPRETKWSEARVSYRIAAGLIELLVGLVSALVIAGYLVCYVGKGTLMDLVRENPWEIPYSVDVQTGLFEYKDPAYGYGHMESGSISLDIDLSDHNIELDPALADVVGGIACAVPFAILIFLLLWSLRPKRTRGAEGKAGGALGRTAIIYAKVFGIHGSHFREKVLMVQMLSVVIQSNRLTMFGVMSGTGQAPSSSSLAQTLSVVAYWAFFGGLVINSLYPAALYAHLISRSSSAFFDAGLDLTYVITYFALSMISNVHPTKMFPITPIEYIGMAMPIIHAYTVSGVIVASSKPKSGSGSSLVHPGSKTDGASAKEDDKDDDTDDGRGSRRRRQKWSQRAIAAVWAVVALAVVSGFLILVNSDVYPLASSECLPCYCSSKAAETLPEVPLQTVPVGVSQTTSCSVSLAPNGKYCIDITSINNNEKCLYKATRPLELKPVPGHYMESIDLLYVNLVLIPSDQLDPEVGLFLNEGETVEYINMKSLMADPIKSRIKLCADVLEPPTQELSCKKLSVAGISHIDLTDSTEGPYTTTMDANAFDGLGPYLLSLWMNGTAKPMLGTIPETLWSLSDLQYFSMADHKFTGNITADSGDGFKNLTSLKMIQTSGTSVGGEFPGVEMAEMKDLEYVLMYATQTLQGTIASQLGSLPKLEGLVMYNTGVSSTIPSSLGSLSHLKLFMLSKNKMDGFLPSEVCELTAATHLWLGDNDLSGTIPTCISNLKSLKSLSIRNTFYLLAGSSCTDNHGVSGLIPTELGQLTHLEGLYLDSNFMSGTIPEEFSTLTNLVDLSIAQEMSTDCSQNTDAFRGLGGTIPASYANLTKLQYFKLALLPTESAVTPDRITGTIPPQLAGMTALRTLRLEGCVISGFIPSQLGELTALQIFNMDHSHTGLQGATAPHTVSGVMPSEFGSMTDLRLLNMQSTELSGAVLETVASMANLVELNVKNTDVSGTLPTQLAALTRLRRLILGSETSGQRNKFSGTIPSTYSSMQELRELRVMRGSLSGTLPPELQSMSSLDQMFVFDNADLSGSIPAEYAALTSLRALRLSKTKVTGTLPAALEALSLLQDTMNNRFMVAVPCDMSNSCIDSSFQGSGKECDTSGSCPVGTGSTFNFKCVLPNSTDPYCSV